MERTNIKTLTLFKGFLILILFGILCQNINAQVSQQNHSSFIDPDYTGEKGTRLSPIIAFRAGKSLIDMNGMANVEQIANYLKGRPSIKIVIEGYAPASSDEDACKRLSAERAAAVKKSLVNTYGISSSRIIANGKGIANSDIIQLQKSGNAVVVYEQQAKEDKEQLARYNTTQQHNTKTHGNNTTNKNNRTNTRNGNDAVNAVNSLIGNALAYGMIGAMTGDNEYCHSCWGTGCSECNYTGKVFVIDKNLTDALYGLYTQGANTLAEQQQASNNTTIKDGYHKLNIGDGETIEGNFKNGYLNGPGKGYNTAGDKYVGNFKDSRPHGKGTMTLSTGDKYVGDFVNGKATGTGMLTLSNGDKYIGQFKNALFNGNGTFYIKAEKKYYKGIWKDNELAELIEEGTWNPSISKRRTTSTQKKK